MSPPSYTIRVPNPSTDAPGMSQVMAPSRWPDPHWRALFKVGTPLSLVVQETAYRLPYNLITSRSARRHQIAVDDSTGEILAYARWVLPERLVVAVEEGGKGGGEVVWEEAMVKGVGEEERREFEGGYRMGLDEKGRTGSLRHEDVMTVRSPPLYEWDEKVLESVGEVLTLDYLSTHPAHQRKGIGAKMLEAGLDLADKLGLKTYVTASPIGLKLYLDHGFEVVKKLEVDYSMYVPGSEKAVDWYMIRQPRSRKA